MSPSKNTDAETVKIKTTEFLLRGAGPGIPNGYYGRTLSGEAVHSNNAEIFRRGAGLTVYYYNSNTDGTHDLEQYRRGRGRGRWYLEPVNTEYLIEILIDLDYI